MRLTLRQADTSDIHRLVVFEQDVAQPKIYGKPLDCDAAAEQISRNQFLLKQYQAGLPAELVVHPDNVAALSLYDSLGFRTLSRHEDYFGDGEPRLLMQLAGRPRGAKSSIIITWNISESG